MFVQTKDRAQELFKELLYDSIHVDVIHSDRSQEQRENTVRAFRSGGIWVLICTELMGRGIDFKAGMYIVPYNLIFFPNPIFWSFFSEISFLFTFFPLDILANSPNIIEKVILIPLYFFFHVIFFPTAMIFPSPFHTLIFFSNRLDKLPLPLEGGIRNLIQPCFKGVNLVINYDFPPSAVSYIHRIGRTGRAGRSGSAVTYFTEADRPLLRSIAQESNPNLLIER